MSCCICQKIKTTLICGVCQMDVCKKCTEFVEPDAFSFLKVIPEKLKASAFCSTCYTVDVLPEIEIYQNIMAKAEDILVFEITQSKETRLIERKEPLVSVVDITDRKEAMLRLAFFAAEKDFNSIIDMDLKPRKVKEGSYQHTLWSGTARPANVSQGKLLKDRSLWSNPN